MPLISQRSLLLPPLDKLRAAISAGPMPSAEAAPYLRAIRWGEEGHYLKEFVAKRNLPQVAKIIKGQHQGLGVPSLPSPNLAQVVLVASAGPKLKVVAQCVKFKERRAVPLGPRLSIPEDYPGWFEILSEDGRSSRCAESVSELARRHNNKRCVVREGLKAYLPRPDDPDSPWDKTRTVASGEILVVGEVVSGSRRGGAGKFLGCVTSFGDNIFLPLDMKGRFSPIAGEDNISGVHTVKSLMSSKRFPLMVRLVHGEGLNSRSQFANEMRLYSLAEEECLVAMPLSPSKGGDAVVALPLGAPLKVLASKNVEELSKMPEHVALTNRCRQLMADVSGTIQLCDGREVKTSSPTSHYVYVRKHSQQNSTYRSIPLVKRSVSDPQGTVGKGTMHLERGMSTPNESPDATCQDATSDVDDVRYDEIDQIYDYVRGFAPLPASIKNEFSAGEVEAQKSPSLLPQIGGDPPEPPPIETIPARKSSTTVVTKPQKITVSIVNRTPSLKTKEIYLPSANHRSQKPSQRKSAEDHIYEKIDKRNRNGVVKLAKVFDAAKTPARSNSASKITNNNCDSNNNTKRPFHHTPASKSRFTKNINHVAGGRIHNKSSQRRLGANAKTLSTSPLFHIRYKSLTDLLMDTKKSDSSNDDQPKESESATSSDSKVESSEETRRLSRPKSLSNLIGGVGESKKRLDNYYHLVENDLIKTPELNKFFSMPESSSSPRYAKNHYSHHAKKFGTLYL